MFVFTFEMWLLGYYEPVCLGKKYVYTYFIKPLKIVLNNNLNLKKKCFDTKV